MTATLPAPPVHADADLRDFPFTPMFRARLFGSSFHARVSDSGWRAGVTLWLKSWDQMPAGSLPDDDIDLCRLAELGRDLKAWKKVKQEALWGWFKCSDGRLYHDVVAQGVNEAWKSKLDQRWRAECARIKKTNQRHQTDIPVPTFDQWMSQRHSPFVPRDNVNLSPGTHPICPDPVPEETASKRQRRDRDRDRDSKIDVDDAGASAAERVLRSIGAWDNPNLRLHAGRLSAWLTAGADVDLDVIPTLQAVLATARRSRGDENWFPSSLNFFDKSIAEAVSRRTRPMPEVQPHGSGHQRQGENYRNGFCELIATGKIG